MDIRYGPIAAWPRAFTKSREHSPFKADYSSTIGLLKRELRMVRARNPVVQLALLPGQFRRDGLPYSDAKPEHPGVIVSFEKPVGLSAARAAASTSPAASNGVVTAGMIPGKRMAVSVSSKAA